jgi:hypothetical protein
MLEEVSAFAQVVVKRVQIFEMAGWAGFLKKCVKVRYSPAQRCPQILARPLV